MESKKISRKELEQNNGTNGKPAYVAYNGKVYEVTDSSFWIGGDHFGAHKAGKDLTEELAVAPHDAVNLERLKYVGELV